MDAWGETIEVTALKGGLALSDGDALRRLRELGVRRTLGPKGVSVKQSPRSEVQKTFLAGYPKIRDLDHYRELVSDPRSKGPLTSFDRGRTITMERTNHPWKKGAIWYVILDTAIGCAVDFLQELDRTGRARIVTVG